MNFIDFLEGLENFYFGIVLGIGVYLLQIGKNSLGIILITISFLCSFLRVRRTLQNRGGSQDGKRSKVSKDK